MIGKVLLEGLGLGALLALVCAVGIRNGAVGMVHLYHEDVQERCVSLGLTTRERIRRNALRFKLLCLPGYIAYVLVCVYAVNGARGFLAGFWQLLVILSVMNLIDRFLVDGYWVGHTKAWTIPGTEDLKPYITAQDNKEEVARRNDWHGMYRRGAFRRDAAFRPLSGYERAWGGRRLRRNAYRARSEGGAQKYAPLPESISCKEERTCCFQKS